MGNTALAAASLLQRQNRNQGQMDSEEEITGAARGRDYFPNELIFEIISRLPVKSLLKFKCVSKLWFSLISSPEFIRMHVQKSLKNEEYIHYGFISRPLYPPCSSIKQCSLQSILEEPITAEIDNSPTKNGWISHAVEINNSPFETLWRSATASIVGSCNGLICLYLNISNIYLWNPSIRKSMKLPNSGYQSLKSFYGYSYGFGYVESSDDYKVVALFSNRHPRKKFETKVKVYSLRNDTWTMIGDFPEYYPNPLPGKFVNGKLHWITFGDVNSIVSLDLARAQYGQLELPNCRKGSSSVTIGELGGCLSLTFVDECCTLDLWVMKLYGAGESWIRMATIPNSCSSKGWISPLWISKKGEILLSGHNVLLLYGPEDDSRRSPNITNTDGFFDDGFFDPHIYVESLVCPIQVRVE